MIIETILLLISAFGPPTAIARQEYKKPKKPDKKEDDKFSGYPFYPSDYNKKKVDNNIFSLTEMQKKIREEDLKKRLDIFSITSQSLEPDKTIYSNSSYWENPLTGDFMKHMINIKKED